LNEFTRGALEATAYYLNLELKEMRKEMERIRDDILSGVAIDFRRRLQMR